MTRLEATDIADSSEHPMYPVIEDARLYRNREQPILKEGSIVHFQFKSSPRDAEPVRHCFKLLKTIGGYRYVLSVTQNVSGIAGKFVFTSETEEGSFALTQLETEAFKELFVTQAAFVDALALYQPVHIESIYSTPSSVGYSVKDIDACVDAILRNPQNTRSAAELDVYRTTVGAEAILRKYRDLYGTSFISKDDDIRNRSAARSRLFKMMFKKYLKRWRVVGFDGGLDFTLERKP